MILYNLHANPEKLRGFDIVTSKVPELACEQAKRNPELRPKLEPAIMKSPLRAYWYARYVLKRRWPEAEPYIMKDPLHWHLYKDMLKYESL